MNKSLLFLFYFLSICYAFSQEIPHDIIDRVNRSKYIFEGEVIRSNSYWNDSHDFIYTSLTFEIYKIFKGNLLCGTVELIAQGGNIYDTTLQITHNLELKVGQLGIFMCIETGRELPAIDFYPENNNQKLQLKYNGQGYIQYFNDGVNPEVVDWQFSIDSIAQVYNLMELYTQLNLIDCGGQPLLNFHRERKIGLARPPLKSTPSVSLALTPPNDTDLYIGIRNPQITSDSSGNKWYEFDITLNDNVDSIYFIAAPIAIRYDSLIFGSQIHNLIGGQKLFVSRGTLLMDSLTYDQINIQSSLRRDEFKILINYDTSNVNLIDLPSVPDFALHVKMKVVNCNLQGFVSLGQLSNNPRYSLVPDTIHIQHGYHANHLGDSILFHGCSLFINSISPLSVRGGVGDSIYIRGNGFGPSRGNGKIFFANADDGGITYIALDSIDYGIWTDSLITVNIPGGVDSVDQYNNSFGTPGSGFIMLKKNGGNDSTFYFGNPITINYSILNAIYDFNFLHKIRSDLVNFYNTTVGGYLLRPDVSITRSDSAFSVVKATIHDWVCETSVNF